MKSKKKKFSLYVVLITLLVSALSCKKSLKDIETDHLSNAISKVRLDQDFNWVVVLPGLGCHGCIQEGEAFVRDHVKNQQILFVLTKISSLKILQQKIGIKAKDFPNVYIDRNNFFTIPTGNSVYPCIIKMEKGKVIDHEFQSPENGAAFAKLNGRVSEQ